MVESAYLLDHLVRQKVESRSQMVESVYLLDHLVSQKVEPRTRMVESASLKGFRGCWSPDQQPL